MSRLQSFQSTPVLFLTEQVHAGLPILTGPAVRAALRDVWLDAAGRDRWFVGSYWILPDRVSLFACPGSSACAVDAWTARWKAAAGVRINRLAGRRGAVWKRGQPPVPMGSESDYRATCEAMSRESSLSHGRHAGPCGSGVLWRLL